MGGWVSEIERERERERERARSSSVTFRQQLIKT